MSHYHLEIIMPPTDDVEEAVGEILKPFDEYDEEARHTFWDFWTIGGRFSGEKMIASLGPNTLATFHEELTKMGVTVSGIQFGKQELSPAEQIPAVDSLWHEMFPAAPDGPCPIFMHSNDESKTLIDDVMLFSQVPASLKMSRIIFAAAPDEFHDKHYATHMVEDSHWNGVSWIDSAWDGSFGEAVAGFIDHNKNCAEAWQERCSPKADWLVVTVDYHS